MARIDFENGYVADIDSMNVTLKKDVKIVTNEKGEDIETCKSLGYFRNLSGAIKEMYEDKVLDKLKNRSTIEEAVQVFKSVAKDIDKITQRFGI